MDTIIPTGDLIDRLRARLGQRGVLTDPADTAPYCEDWRRLYHGRTPAVLRPATVEEVADAVRLCAERGVPIVPQGGNTSMVGGAAVREEGDQIILSLSRMNRVRAIDPVDMTMEIEAGLPWKAAQEGAGAIQAYEYMSGPGIELVLRHIPGAALPLGQPAAHYVLVELATPRQGAELRASLEELLAAAMEAGLVADAVIAESGAQRMALWKLREEHSEAQKLAGASVKNDVSVPVSKVPELIRRATEACERLVPGIRCVPFGHLGDCNIHFNLVQPEGGNPEAFLARDHALMDAVNAVVRALDGSF